MRTRFWGFGEDVDVVTREELRRDEVAQSFVSTRAAGQCLRRLAQNMGAMRRLRRVGDFGRPGARGPRVFA